MKNIHITILLMLFQVMLFSQETKKTMKELLSNYSYTTHYVKLDSVEVAYVKEGKGKTTLVFVHGLSSNLDAWKNNVSTLKNKYTCVALDLPGYGKSSKLKTNYTASYFAAIVKEFIDRLQLKNVILVGHSMGGQASIKLAVTYPEVIEKLVLLAPAGLESFSELHANFMKNTFTPTFVMNTTDAQIEKNYALNFYKQPKDVSVMIKDRKEIKKSKDFKVHAEAIVSSISGMLDDPVTNDLASVKHSTLVIFGKQDMLIPNRYMHPELTTEKVANIAAENIKRATVKLIDEAGHFVQYEQALKVNKLIETFVEAN